LVWDSEGTTLPWFPLCIALVWKKSVAAKALPAVKLALAQPACMAEEALWQLLRVEGHMDCLLLLVCSEVCWGCKGLARFVFLPVGSVAVVKCKACAHRHLISCPERLGEPRPHLEFGL